jgi:serine/threonine-protein kinase RsbW
VDDLATAPLRLCVRRAPTRPGTPDSIVLELPADVRCVEEAVELMARHCFAGTPAPSRRTSFRLRVLLAEAISNSILFGAGGDPARRVRVQAELSESAIRLEVTDDGPGFNPGDVPDPTLPDGLARPIGRGLFLIKSLADRVEFNQQGNTIWMTLPRS